MTQAPQPVYYYYYYELVRPCSIWLGHKVESLVHEVDIVHIKQNSDRCHQGVSPGVLFAAWTICLFCVCCCSWCDLCSAMCYPFKVVKRMLCSCCTVRVVQS